MLDEWYNSRLDYIDSSIKLGIQKVSENLNTLSDNEEEEHFSIINKLEENFNIQLASISKELYIKGFKDCMNLVVNSLRR